DTAQCAKGNALHQALVVLAVTFRRRDPHADLVAGVAAGQLLLQARDDVAVAVKIGQGLARGGAVDDRTVVVLEGVVDRNYAIGGYGHRGLRGIGSRESIPAGAALTRRSASHPPL